MLIRYSLVLRPPQRHTQGFVCLCYYFIVQPASDLAGDCASHSDLYANLSIEDFVILTQQGLRRGLRGLCFFLTGF